VVEKCSDKAEKDAVQLFRATYLMRKCWNFFLILGTEPDQHTTNTGKYLTHEADLNADAPPHPSGSYGSCPFGEREVCPHEESEAKPLLSFE